MKAAVLLFQSLLHFN